jgi:hypothetical protein
MRSWIGIVSVVVILSIVWIGFDHRTIKTRYGYSIIRRDATGWIVECVILWIFAFPSYLSHRRSQRLHPMWPWPNGQPISFEDQWGGLWHRGTDGTWYSYDPTLGWTSVAIRRMPFGMRLEEVDLESESDAQSTPKHAKRSGSEWDDEPVG